MKFAAHLAVISLVATFNMAYAADEPTSESDILAYCNEQVDMAGIEDAAEKKAALDDCVNSFAQSANTGNTPAE